MLCFFGSFLQALERHFVLAQIYAVFLFKFISQEVDQSGVKVVSTKEGISVGWFDFKDSVSNFENGNIECSSTKIKDGNLLIWFFVQAISQWSRRRFVDDPKYIQTSDFACIFRCLPLAVIEVGWNSNDCVSNRLSKIVFSCLLHLLKNESWNFRRRIALTIYANVGQIICSTCNLERGHRF